MKPLILLLLVGALLPFSSCKSDAPKEKTVGDIKKTKPTNNADLVRNPVTPENVDTVNVAKMTFEEKTYNFGTVKEKDVVVHTFKFTNTGKIPLVITNCNASCGCTVPECPKDVIDPGKGGSITVRFNTKGKVGDQRKAVTVTANTYPNTTTLDIIGKVEER